MNVGGWWVNGGMASTGGFTQTQLQRIDAAVTRIQAIALAQRRLDAELMEALAEALEAGVGPGSGRGGELAHRSLRLEISQALQESEAVAERLLDTASSITQSYPNTLNALRAGEVALRHARVVAEEGAVIHTGQPEADARRRADYEHAVLESARDETPNRLRPIARRLAAEQAEATVEERHEGAVRARHVRVVDLEDGMADLIAHLPAVEAYAMRDRLTRIAKLVTEGERRSRVESAEPGEPRAPGASCSGGRDRAPRTRDEARADVLRDLVLTGIVPDAEVSGDGIHAQVQVIVPGHVLGLPDAAGTAVAPGVRGVPELVGHGPISSGAASRVAGDAGVWERVTVDHAGHVLAVDRYHPTPQMRRVLAARDVHCRAPGCRVPANRCDIDHTVDAALGGPTRTDNLAHLCRGHHTLKHHTDWQVEQRDGGELSWTSPSGRQYTDRPPSRVRFRRVETSTGEPKDGASEDAGSDPP